MKINNKNQNYANIYSMYIIYLSSHAKAFQESHSRARQAIPSSKSNKYSFCFGMCVLKLRKNEIKTLSICKIKIKSEQGNL